MMARKTRTYTRGAEEIRAFARELGKMPKEVRRELRPRLKSVGAKALISARLRAAWSTRIPRATRLKIGLSQRNPGLAIEVDRKRAPHARPYENNDEDGIFLAPFFGNKNGRWYGHRARPFLVRGARPWFETTDRDVAEVVDDVARRTGFR
ncbi:HK97 gp10 family phage protein [Spongiactinospora rosea]|uniref:HK97 gp10 family phage protein n=1 Tax=Spongiactinospora rosea TaxID=2248750 RepID=A0A366M7B0_9ACTN|nr:HK97 gp10 family phage protein [Spongiactinospora rosea]RBQ21620.1 HK97 gp10 family phage protein [Spongiactinospora rosea]